jgi:hypothetical protein
VCSSIDHGGGTPSKRDILLSEHLKQRVQSFVGKCTQGRRRRWPVDTTSDRDTTGSLKSSRRLKEVGVYAIPSQRIQTGRPGDLRTG